MGDSPAPLVPECSGDPEPKGTTGLASLPLEECTLKRKKTVTWAEDEWNAAGTSSSTDSFFASQGSRGESEEVSDSSWQSSGSESESEALSSVAERGEEARSGGERGDEGRPSADASDGRCVDEESKPTTSKSCSPSPGATQARAESLERRLRRVKRLRRRYAAEHDRTLQELEARFFRHGASGDAAAFEACPPGLADLAQAVRRAREAAGNAPFGLVEACRAALASGNLSKIAASEDVVPFELAERLLAHAMPRLEGEAVEALRARAQARRRALLRAGPRLEGEEAAEADALARELDARGASGVLVGERGRWLVRGAVVGVGRGRVGDDVGFGVAGASLASAGEEKGDSAESPRPEARSPRDESPKPETGPLSEQLPSSPPLFPAQVDVDLSLDLPPGPGWQAGARRISRRAALLWADGEGRWRCTASGRRQVRLDGVVLAPGASAELAPVALLETGGVRCLWMANLRAVRRRARQAAGVSLEL